MKYGYVRVSSTTQNERRQVAELIKRGLQHKNIFVDKCSGKNFDRPGYKKLLKKLRPGDIVLVHSIDRFGRNYDEILREWSRLTKEKKVDIVVLDMPLLDTRKKTGAGDLLSVFLSDIVLQILSYVAETQRRSIRRTQAEGIKMARENGIRFGRPIKLERKEFLELYERSKGRCTVEEFCRKAGISRGTYYKYLREYIE